MRTPKSYPKTIKVGSVVVKVYRLRHATTADGWVYSVAWGTVEGRKMKQFADEATAMEEARLKATQLASGRIEASDVSRSDRDELHAARKICGATPIIVALREWSRARDLTASNVVAAAEAWSARQGTAIQTVLVKEAVNAFMNAKEKAGVDVRASYKKVLPTLTVAFGERSFHTVTSRELSAWMDQRHPNPVTRNTVRKRIVTLWRWSRRQGFISRDAVSEAEQTDAVKEPKAKIGIIDRGTYTSLLRLFRNAHPEYLAALILAGFCGLRRSEIHGQSWEDIKTDRKFVRVTSAKKNTPAMRLVPLSNCAIHWLDLCVNRKGLVCGNIAMDRIRDIGRTAKFSLPDNCFRHSFISHRVAQTGNVAETALEAGNSPQIIFRHYRELVTKDEGQAWFEIAPPRKS